MVFRYSFNSSRLDTGEIVTAPYVEQLIDEIAPTVSKIAPAVKEKELQVTVQYLKSQIKATWPSEFLTSDLMPYLAAADGVDAKFLKAAL